MKILLDESLPKDLRLHLPGHQVSTVPERGWASRSNGDLLQLAGSEIDAFLTADQNLEYQQNPAKYNIPIVVLAARSNRIQDLVPLVPRLLQLLPDLRPGQLARVAA